MWFFPKTSKTDHDSTGVETTTFQWINGKKRTDTGHSRTIQNWKITHLENWNQFAFESLTKVIPNIMLIEQDTKHANLAMATKLAFETSAQSTCQAILAKLMRSLVTFRSTAPVDKVSQLLIQPTSQPPDDDLVGSLHTKLIRVFSFTKFKLISEIHNTRIR